MMVQTRSRRTREVRGPQPHSVAIFAKPTRKQPAEHLILERRKEEESRAENDKLLKYSQYCDLKNNWERWTDKKIQLNTVKRKVNHMMQAQEFCLEARRERLRQLLSEEEMQYKQHMEDKEETLLERQAKMRERAKTLKEQRESERLAYVQDKLDQQWRNQCEELRATLSKRQQDQVAVERIKQLEIKENIEKAKREEDQMYADLWYADMEAKAKKEEEQTKRQMSANREMVDVLQKQIAALEARKNEEKALVAEEARLLQEQAELRKIEERQAAEERRRKQQETRDMFSRSLQMKLQKQAKEMQEQLAFDMKILEQLLEESRNEAKAQLQRKKELRAEDRKYREYLKQLKEEERRNELEVERICDAEVEKMWQKKLAQWRLEKEARQRLLQEVLNGRKSQIQEKLIANERRLAEAQREREEIIHKIEENKRYERQQVEKIKSQNLQHQNDILGQINYNRQIREEAIAEEERLNQLEAEAELEYRKKLEDALANPEIDKLHPVRRPRQSHSGRSQVADLLG